MTEILQLQARIADEIRLLKVANNCHDNELSVVSSGVASYDNELNRKKPAYLISSSNAPLRTNYTVMAGISYIYYYTIIFQNVNCHINLLSSFFCSALRIGVRVRQFCHTCTFFNHFGCHIDFSIPYDLRKYIRTRTF